MWDGAVYVWGKGTQAALGIGAEVYILYNGYIYYIYLYLLDIYYYIYYIYLYLLDIYYI